MSFIRLFSMSCIGVAALHLALAFSTVAAQELPEHVTPVRSPPMLFIGRGKSQLQIDASLEQQCRRLFESVSSSRHIGFAHASDHLSTNAFSLLDELVQIAADCPSAAITVTGNTDNSGDEPGNLQLSKARADSVIAYMVARGIAADRLQSHGAGSSAPLATEDSARARELNRRIDFEIFFPDQPD